MKKLIKICNEVKPKSRKEWILTVLAIVVLVIVLYVVEYLGWDLPIRTQDRMFEK